MFGLGDAQVRIHTTLDREDQAYCRKHNLKYAHLLRASIRDHRLHSGDPSVAPSIREIRDQKNQAVQHRDRIIKALLKHMGKEDFDKFIQKI